MRIKLRNEGEENNDSKDDWDSDFDSADKTGNINEADPENRCTETKERIAVAKDQET